jgi:diacylglycerol kinase (ATP)
VQRAGIWEPGAPRRAALITNVGSRHGGALFRRAMAVLGECGLDVCHPCRLTRADDLPRQIESALAQGIRLIIIGGGDGTLNAAVNLLAGHDVVLGVLPLGTANDFARAVGIPLTLEAACRTVVQGRVARVDLGRVNDRYFLSTVSIGFTAHAARRVLPWAKRYLGRGGYLLASARAFLGYRGFHARVHLDGRPLAYDALELVIGNGRFHSGGHLLAPDASLHSGRLVCYAFEGLSRWQLLKMALIVYRGRHIYHRQAHFATAGEIQIEAEPSQPVLVDGDRRGRTPVRATVIPGGLAVVAPATGE